MLEKDIDRVNKGYDSQIKKMADQTSRARKQGSEHMSKSIGNLVEKVQDVDEKRDQMASEITHLIDTEYCEWLTSWCIVLTTEEDFFRKAYEELHDTRISKLLVLATQEPPELPLTTWRNDFQVRSHCSSPFDLVFMLGSLLAIF